MIKKSKIKIIKILSLGIIVFYFLMLIPVFFMYPKYNQPIELNFQKEWFTEFSKHLKGDCFRKAQDFIRENPFPSREVHLNSIHTIVEININGKWIAYDPCLDLFFDNQNVAQISFDVKRGYIMESMKNYPYKDAFVDFHYYHNFYFIILNYTHPYYNGLIRLYYGIIN